MPLGICAFSNDSTMIVRTGVIGPSLSGWLYEGYGSSAPAAVSGWLCAAAMGIVLAVPLQPPAAKRKPD